MTFEVSFSVDNKITHNQEVTQLVEKCLDLPLESANCVHALLHHSPADRSCWCDNSRHQPVPNFPHWQERDKNAILIESMDVVNEIMHVQHQKQSQTYIYIGLIHVCYYDDPGDPRQRIFVKSTEQELLTFLTPPDDSDTKSFRQ